MNNHLENLEWCTNQENQIHARKAGLCKDLKGEKNPASKLSEEKVKEIIQLLLEGKSATEISKLYNISKSTISSIRTHRNWKHLTEGILFPGQSSTTIPQGSTL